MWSRLQVLASLCLCVRAASLIQPEWAYYFDQDDEGPGTYSFGYDIEDSETRNIQFKREKRLPNGTVTGRYGLVEPDGNIKIVHYTADAFGYRAVIENSQRASETHPLQPADKLWNNPPSFWDFLWDPPSSYSDRQPSPVLGHALESIKNLGSPVFEERTPPASQRVPSNDQFLDKPLRSESSADQSPSYPAYLPVPPDYKYREI